ncbi:MAG TPA: hypothetical protein VMN36_01215 [Verrucomicrobiales bacterium]|nr:hypothetical protein [Verrucomicrobiales bacterium]
MAASGSGVPLCGAESGAPPAQSQEPPSIRWSTPSGADVAPKVELTGLPEDSLRIIGDWAPDAKAWKDMLAVYAAAPGQTLSGNVPAMAGTYRVALGKVEFEPRFPLQAGLDYRAILKPGQIPGAGFEDPEQVAVLRLPAEKREPVTGVSAVFPSASTLPENLLKFYFHFSNSMSRGELYSHLRLEHSGGAQVDLPFLELNEELWDSERKRVTVFIDPGRIKRGLRPREEAGPALEEGQSYVLVIDAGLLDGSGLPLREAFRKTFRAGPPDTTPPDPSLWDLSLPRSGSREPLVASFGESLDHALALRLLEVVTAEGMTVAGNAELGVQESRWTFTPSTEWIPGDYRIHVPNILEDLAGNQVGRTFDVDIFDEAKPLRPEKLTVIPFRIR